MRRFRLSSLAFGLFGLAASTSLACGSGGTTEGEGVGDDVGTEESEGQEESETGTPAPGCEGSPKDLAFDFVGSSSPADPCDALDFSGRYMGEGEAPGTYLFDGCPCDMDCADEDPHTLTLDAPEGAGFEALPELGTCVGIGVERDPETCVPIHLGITDDTNVIEGIGGAVLYYASRRRQGPVSELFMFVSAVDPLDCGADTVYGLESNQEGEFATIAEGESVLIPDPIHQGGSLRLMNLAARDTPEGEYFRWVLQR